MGEIRRIDVSEIDLDKIYRTRADASNQQNSVKANKGVWEAQDDLTIEFDEATNTAMVSRNGVGLGFVNQNDLTAPNEDTGGHAGQVDEAIEEDKTRTLPDQEDTSTTTSENTESIAKIEVDNSSTTSTTQTNEPEYSNEVEITFDENEVLDDNLDTNTQTTESDNTTNTSSVSSTSADGIKTVTIDVNNGQCYTCENYNTRVGKWHDGSRQKQVSEMWVDQGQTFENGLATINVDGQKRYLVATTEVFGVSGDVIDVHLEDGTTIPCVICDTKSSHDSNYSKYGHTYGNQVNVLEWAADVHYTNNYGNPTSTNEYKLPWDSNSKVKSIDNTGTILKG